MQLKRSKRLATEQEKNPWSLAVPRAAPAPDDGLLSVDTASCSYSAAISNSALLMSGSACRSASDRACCARLRQCSGVRIAAVPVMAVQHLHLTPWSDMRLQQRLRGGFLSLLDQICQVFVALGELSHGGACCEVGHLRGDGPRLRGESEPTCDIVFVGRHCGSLAPFCGPSELQH
jgi:hypothetical protein